MLRIISVVLLVKLSLLSVSCATYNDEKNDMNEPGALDLILCEKPRPQICTREYNPVCATYKDETIKTSSSGCTSCSDSEVIGYKPGAC